jgi:RNA-binding motif protein, X-linked 2
MDVNLPRDKETGKTKGFGFLMYEDQRSTVLAVDNLNGTKVLEKTLRVDHVKNYKQPKLRNEDGEWIEPEEQSLNAKPEMIIGEFTWMPGQWFSKTVYPPPQMMMQVPMLPCPLGLQ